MSGTNDWSQNLKQSYIGSATDSRPLYPPFYIPNNERYDSILL